MNEGNGRPRPHGLREQFPSVPSAAGESIKRTGRGRIGVLLRQSAQSASWFQPTVPAERRAPLPRQWGEKPVDAEGNREELRAEVRRGEAAPAARPVRVLMI